MVKAISANGNRMLHRCHYVHHHWSQWIAIGTIFVAIGAKWATGVPAGGAHTQRYATETNLVIWTILTDLVIWTALFVIT